jgi:hypothetical protein
VSKDARIGTQAVIGTGEVERHATVGNRKIRDLVEKIAGPEPNLSTGRCRTRGTLFRIPLSDRIGRWSEGWSVGECRR